MMNMSSDNFHVNYTKDKSIRSHIIITEETITDTIMKRVSLERLTTELKFELWIPVK